MIVGVVCVVLACEARARFGFDYDDDNNLVNVCFKFSIFCMMVL